MAKLRVITRVIARAAAGIVMVNMNSDEAIAQTGSARAEVTTPNKNSSNHSPSDANLQPTNRDLALTRKRTGHIDAAVRFLGHFVAAALVVLWSVFQLVGIFLHDCKEPDMVGLLDGSSHEVS